MISLKNIGCSYRSDLPTAPADCRLPTAVAVCRLSRGDQPILLLGPVLIEVLQNVVLLQRAVAISHRQVRPAEVVIRLAKIGLQLDRPLEGFHSIRHEHKVHVSFTYLIWHVGVPRFQRRELFVSFNRQRIFLGALIS